VKASGSSSSSVGAGKKILVTGAGGYIGNAVVRALRAAGHLVSGLIRNAADSSELVIEEIRPVLGKLSTVDVTDYDIVVDTATGGTPDDGKLSESILNKVIAFNAEHPAAKKLYIYTSGCMVLGDYPNELVKEDAPPKNKAFEWRAALERKIIAAGHVALRPGWVYGGNGGHYAAPWFKLDSKEGDLVLKGKPDKIWSWVHITDLAAAYALVVRAPVSTVAGQIFAVGDVTKMTYAQVRESMARAAGFTGRITFTPKEGAIECSCHQDTSKIRSVLGWAPSRRSYDDGMPLYYAAWAAYTAAHPPPPAPAKATPAPAPAPAK